MKRSAWHGPAAEPGGRLRAIWALAYSTLTRWISQRRDQDIDLPDRSVSQDMASELKQLRRENEVLRQERDILKKATAFFAREGNR